MFLCSGTVGTGQQGSSAGKDGTTPRRHDFSSADVGILNGVFWIGPARGQFPSLTACYSALPDSGGTCMVTPGWKETLSSNLILDKSNAGFVFMGPATITQGANEVVINDGVVGTFLIGLSSMAGASANSSGVKFAGYTGNGNAWQWGSSSGSGVQKVRIENVWIDLTSAGPAATAINAFGMGYSHLVGLNLTGAGGSVAQKGLVFNNSGEGGFSGGNFIQHFIAGGMQVFLQFNGDTVENTVQSIIFTGSAAGGTGIDFEGPARSNVVQGGTISGTGTAINFGGTATENVVTVETDAAATDVAFAAGTTRNRVVRLDSTGHPVPVISNAGVLNTVTNAGGVVFSGGSLLNEQGSTNPVTGNSTDQTIFSYTLPANVIAGGRGIRVRAAVTHSGGTAPVAFTLFFGDTPYSMGSSSDTTNVLYDDLTIFNDPGVANSQHGVAFHRIASPSFTVAVRSSVDTTAPVAIRVIFNAPSTETITPQEFIVELVQ